MSTGWGEPNNTVQSLEARIRELEDQNRQLARQLEDQKQHIQKILQQALNDLSSGGRRDSKYNSSSGGDRSRSRYHSSHHRRHDPLPDQGNVFEEFKKGHPEEQHRKRGRGGRRRNEYGCPPPEECGNPGRRQPRPSHQQQQQQGWDMTDLNDPAGWDMGETTNNAGGWDVVAPPKAAEQTHPVMPGSVARMTSTKSEIPSSVDKVNKWQESGTVASSENIPWAPEGVVIDDSEDDSEDPKMQLFSKRRRSEMSASALEDGEGNLITLERMAPLWRIFAWIPLDDLSIHYKTQYGVDLCDQGSKKKARMTIKNMPGLSERLSMDDKNKQQILLFKDKGHLKQVAAYQRLFVKSPVLEPVLFLFLITTVRQPLAYQQAGMVEKLWKDEFGKTPVGMTTAKHSNGEGQIQWKTIKSVWQAAIQWLKDLASTTATHGPRYLANKLTAWAGGGVEDSSQWKITDPGSLLVAGLMRDELNALLRASPHLLKDIMQESEIRRLWDELDFD